jgi:hypothetical protein
MSGKLLQKPISRPETVAGWSLLVETLEPHEYRGNKLRLIGMFENLSTRLRLPEIIAT